MGVSGLVVGHDFHFGRGREGTPDFLVEEGRRLGIAVEVVPPLAEGDKPVSSSSVRKALEHGDVEQAARLLGHRFILRGRVQHGDKRGRTLGYPTANLQLAPETALAHGIYAVRAAVDGVVHGGVASFGRRPTFDDGPPLFEVFLFDFSGDLYGKTLDVELCARIRGEEKFDTVQALIARMDMDSLESRQALARGPDVPAPSLLPLPR
jgi:riboflavin kinase/FMN adenylyltransferase